MKNCSGKILKKLLISFVLLALLTSAGMTIVLGDGGSSGNNSGGNGGDNSCSDCSCSYHTAHNYGVRISLVYWGADKSNQRVEGTHSIDVFASKTLPSGISYLGGSVYTIPNDNSAKYNRVDMITSVINTTSNPSLTTTNWDSIPKYTASDLGWSSSSGISFNYSSIATTNPNYAQVVSSLYTTMQKEVDAYKATNYTDENKIKITLKLFDALGVDFSQFNAEQLKGMHLMIEPVVMFAVKGTSNTTSNYRLFYGTITQAAYAFQRYNCNGSGHSKWSLADSVLMNEYGVLLYAASPCNTTGDMKYCTLEGWAAGSKPNNRGRDYREALTAVVGNHTGLTDTGAKTSHGVGYIWLGSLNMPPEENCTSTVGYFNDLYDANKITKSQYDNYISQVRNGTLEYTDPDTGKVYKITTPQEKDFLIKSVYDKFNSGHAACADREETSQACDAAVEYINGSSDYPRGSEAYHNAIDQVEAGTFTYELADGTIVKIDQAYAGQFNMLDRSYYDRLGGVAACRNADKCEMIGEPTIEIDECDTGKTYFRDVNDEVTWLECEVAYGAGSKLYSSDNTGHDAVENPGSSGRGGVVGNVEYCEVYCYEEIETTFPTHVHDVKAGQTFTWGTPDGIFGTVNVRKKCKTQNYVRGQQGYRFDEWEKDYTDNTKAMIKDYLESVAYNAAVDTITSSYTGKTYHCDEKCFCTNEDGSPGCCRYTGCPKYHASASSSSVSKSYNTAYGNITGTASSDSASGSSWTSSSDARDDAEDNLEADLKRAANSAYSDYQIGKDQETKLLDIISECTNNLDYVYATTIQFVFKEPINDVYGANSRSFEFNDKLIVEETVNPDSNIDTSRCNPVTMYLYSCTAGSSVSCRYTTKVVQNCQANGVEWNLNGVYTHKYPTQYFIWYTLKTDSTLVNEEEKGSEDEAFFYSVGFGLPTALSLTDGTYELKAIVYDLGDKAQINGGAPIYERPLDTHFDPLGLPVNTNEGSKKGFEYICTYEVDNEVFGYDCQYDSNGNLLANSPKHCDTDKDDDSNGSLLGIDITYRLVTLLDDGDSLDKAFPGRDGSGRNPGSNWLGLEEEIAYILRASVYNDPAMYEIMLDVNAIQAIRKDNQTYFAAGKDPYASYYDANNAQKVYCAEDGDEKYCASDFISDLYNGSGLNYRLLGTCLPSGNTLERAEYVLEHGCNTPYTYPNINWVR